MTESKETVVRRSILGAALAAACAIAIALVATAQEGNEGRCEQICESAYDHCMTRCDEQGSHRMCVDHCETQRDGCLNQCRV